MKTIHIFLIALLLVGSVSARNWLESDNARGFNLTGATQVQASVINATSQVCINNVCQSSWPSGGGASTTTIASTDSYISVANGSTTNLTANLTTFDARYTLLSTFTTWLASFYTNVTGVQAGVASVNTTAVGAVTVNNGQYTNITILQSADSGFNTSVQGLAANISSVNTTQNTVNAAQYANITILQGADSAFNTSVQNLAANISSVNTSQNTVNAAQYTNITILQSAESRTNTSLTSINATAVAGLGTGLSGLSANQLLVASSATNLTIANISVTSNGTGLADYTVMTFNGNRSNLGYQNGYFVFRAGSGKFVALYAEDTLVYNATSLGTRIYGMLNVSGNLNASNFTGGSVNTPTVCISGDCRSSWPAAGGGNTTAEVQAAA